MHPGHSPLPRLGRPASPSACREFFRTKLDKVARNPLRCRLDTSAPLRLLLLRLLQRSALPYSILHPPLTSLRPSHLAVLSLTNLALVASRLACSWLPQCQYQLA